MIDVPKLVACLRELSDAEFQGRSWLASAGPAVSSFAELVSQTFDDTGLADALDSGSCPPELDQGVFSALRSLDSAVARVDQAAPPERLLKDPLVEQVRQLAARALALFAR